MNAMNMPVKELLKNEVARTEACGWVLVGCGLLLDAVTLIGNLAEGRGVLAAFQAGIVPVLFGGWLLDRARLMAQVAAAGRISIMPP
jgi:hypothetical protein